MIWLLLIQSVNASQSSALITLEAERGHLINGANAQGANNASGGGIAGFLGGDKDGAVVFEDVGIKHSGRYILTVRYATADARSLNITVNADQKITMHCPATSGWFSFSEMAKEVILRAGKNTIMLDNNRGWAPNIDNITLKPKPFWTLLKIWILVGFICLGASLSIYRIATSRKRIAS